MYLRFIRLPALSLVIVWLGSCATGSDSNTPELPDGSWQPPALENREVNAIHTNQQNIYAGTDQGMYVKALSSNQAQWKSINLAEEQIVDFVILGPQELLTGTAIPAIESNQTSLFKTEDEGNNWQTYQNGFGGEQYNWISAMAVHPDNKNTIYARGIMNVAKSTDRGSKWESIYRDWDEIGFARFIEINPWNTDIVWTGGATPIFTSHLIKSMDAGETWTRVDPVKDNVEATCYDVTFSEDKNRVLVGMSGGIRKTTDGGQNWHTVFDWAGIYTLTHSPRHPEVIYASGINQAGTLFFIASTDFGDTWELVEYTNSPDSIQINDMTSVIVEGREVLYLGTNQGVYRYTFES